MAEKCIFMGYSEESKPYSLYNPITNKVVRNMDVEYIENESWDGLMDFSLGISIRFPIDEK